MRHYFKNTKNKAPPSRIISAKKKIKSFKQFIKNDRFIQQIYIFQLKRDSPKNMSHCFNYLLLTPHFIPPQ